MPSLTKFPANLASVEITRKSATSARPSPPPTAAPWISAITGFRQANNRTACTYKRLAPPDAISLSREKFAPAQNDFPSDASTSTRQARSRSRASNASARSEISLSSKKLCGGRWISTRAMCAESSTEISGTIDSPLLIHRCRLEIAGLHDRNGGRIDVLAERRAHLI